VETKERRSNVLRSRSICMWFLAFACRDHGEGRERTLGGREGTRGEGEGSCSIQIFTHARTDFLLELVLVLVRLVKLRAVARGDDQLGRVVAGGIASHDCRESGQAQEEEGAARKEGVGSREPGPPASSRRGHC